VGFFDALLGGRRRLKAPAPSRLFAMATAHVTLEASAGLHTAGKAAIVFQPLSTADFEEVVADMEAVVRGTGTETGTAVSTHDDSFGYRWLIFADPDFEDLVVGVNAVAQALQDGGYGERVLAAVFAFRDARERPVHWIYNNKRGAWYPFAPTGGQERDTERELRLKAQAGAELPIEPELERWFPLWDVPL
jgi:hypothetical protein